MKKIIFAMGCMIAIAGAGLMVFVHGSKYLSVNIALVMLGAALMRQSAYFADTLFHNATPQNFYPTAGKMIPWFAWLAAIMACLWLVYQLCHSPDGFSAR